MNGESNAAKGDFALEVVSIREHGVTCKVTGGREGGFATLPVYLVEGALAVVGKALAIGATFWLNLSTSVPVTASVENSFTMPAPNTRMVSDGASQSPHAPTNGNRV